MVTSVLLVLSMVCQNRPNTVQEWVAELAVEVVGNTTDCVRLRHEIRETDCVAVVRL